VLRLVANCKSPADNIYKVVCKDYVQLVLNIIRYSLRVILGYLIDSVLGEGIHLSSHERYAVWSCQYYICVEHLQPELRINSVNSVETILLEDKQALSELLHLYNLFV
jgi:hypothetical protein